MWEKRTKESKKLTSKDVNDLLKNGVYSVLHEVFSLIVTHLPIYGHHTTYEDLDSHARTTVILTNSQSKISTRFFSRVRRRSSTIRHQRKEPRARRSLKCVVPCLC